MILDLVVRPVTSAIGAEVSGVDLSGPLPASVHDALRQALLDHLVLFFRDQHLDPASMRRFAESFGPLMLPVVARAADDRDDSLVPGISVLDQIAPRGQGADRWHSDHMFLPTPPMATMLTAVRLPRLGGDTCFASTYAAYETLSPPLQRFLDGLSALNSGAPVVVRQQNVGGVYKGDVLAQVRPPEVQPVVRVHPETGRKALYVSGNFTTRIVELAEDESTALLHFLFGHIGKPEFQCRFRWEDGSVALWDNRSVQHCGIPDYTEQRVMYRAMIAGDAPIGPGGLADYAKPLSS